MDGALFLLALLTAQSERRPVAPTRRMTLEGLGLLRDHAVIALPSPLPRWEAEPRAEETPMEGLQWRYDWSAYQRADLVAALSDYLESISTDEEAVELRLTTWRQLVKAECQQYFEFYLTRIHLPVDWAADVEFLLGNSAVELSLAQWRYCLWAAARQGGSMAAQKAYAETAIREAMFEDAKRRAAAIASGRWTTTGFDARPGEPASALTRVFLNHFARIGNIFYMQPPSPRPWLTRSRSSGVGD
ncbi:hypothetical protein [Lysobacter sp. HA18]